MDSRLFGLCCTNTRIYLLNQDGDVGAQEEMLRTQSNNVVNAAASKNIFHFVWGN